MRKNSNTMEIYAVGIYNKGYLREDGSIISDILRADFYTKIEDAELERDIYNGQQTDNTYAYVRVLELWNKGTHEFEYPL